MGAIPKTKDADEFRASNEFRPIWIFLTAVWGVAQLVSAALLVIAMIWLPMEPFLLVRTALGIPLTAVLITFSFWFPVWYFRRSSARSPGEKVSQVGFESLPLQAASHREERNPTNNVINDFNQN